ncbi:MAG TPA: YihY/virulence factor BrkB family protein [Chloroflexota bacterium]|nr:YihY/virulence factor BrkB family protein [Chloroflexota bacterium]
MGDSMRTAAVPRQEHVSTPLRGGLMGWLARLRARVMRHALGRVVLSTAEGFQRDQITTRAAALTYFGIFSLFPLLLVLMALAGFALQSNEAAREQILSLIVGLLPEGQQELRKVVQGVIDAKGTATLIGLASLLWAALGWFQVIDDNINAIWGVSTPRAFVKGKLFALAMVGALGAVAGLSFLATAAINLLERFTQAIPGSAAFWQALVSLVSFLALAVVFFVLYRYTPRRPVQAADIWPAALVTAGVWEVTRRLLALYLERTDLISGYGPIGAAMALLFWLYVVGIVMLTGAELAYAIAKERRHIAPAAELPVQAPPGEQPPPTFAPQVGSRASPPGSGARGAVRRAGVAHYLVGGIGAVVGVLVGVALVARRQLAGRASR